MSFVVSTASADAPYGLKQKDVKQFVLNLFSNHEAGIERMISIFDNSNVETRHFSAPIDWFMGEHTFAEKNKLYIETAVNLSEKVIEKCLQKAGASVDDIDHIIFVSSTGISTPSIDAVLFNKLKLNRHVKRTPLWGLGCAGGAAGMSRAMEYTSTFPSQNVIVIAVELCSLTFIKNDYSKSNIVATSLFSDGAAAVLVSGEKSRLIGKKKIKLVNSLSTIYDNSLDVMGWNIVEEGLRVVFSKDIPSIIKDCVKPNIDELLDINGITLKDIKYYVSHPGGVKVLNAYEESLILSGKEMDISRKVLREHGNMSSPSVMYVLNEFLENNNFDKGKNGLISALGPGFSSELLLFETV